jgi:hypothetical protein
MRAGAHLLAAALVAACGEGGAPPPDVTSEPGAHELDPPPLPPDPPAIEGEPIAFRFVLGAEDDGEHVATATDDGYSLEARDADGATRWTTSALGARGEVQARAEASARGVLVFVRAESGDFVDLVDADRGAIVGRARFEARVTRAPIEPAPAASAGRAAWGGRWPASESGIAWRGREPRTRGMESAIEIVRGASTETAWTFRDPYGCIRLALVEVESTLLAAQHCESTTGAVVRAIAWDGEPTPRERWVARAPGLAHPAHTTRANDVAIAIDDDLVRVWGAEADGRWVTTLDLETGAEVATLVLRSGS